MTDETTTIEISHENWQWLSALKQRPGDSFDDVVSRLRDQCEQTGDPKTATGGHEADTEDMTIDASEAVLGDVANEESHELQEEIEPVDVPSDLDLPGSGETYEKRRQTIGTLVAFLQAEGTATRADFLELIDPDDVGYSSAESFWSNSIKGRNSLSAVEGVEPPSEGGHNWRWTDNDEFAD